MEPAFRRANGTSKGRRNTSRSASHCCGATGRTDSAHACRRGAANEGMGKKGCEVTGPALGTGISVFRLARQEATGSDLLSNRSIGGSELMAGTFRPRRSGSGVACDPCCGIRCRWSKRLAGQRREWLHRARRSSHQRRSRDRNSEVSAGPECLLRTEQRGSHSRKPV